MLLNIGCNTKFAANIRIFQKTRNIFCYNLPKICYIYKILLII